jgi:hypothetical protein
VAIAVSDLRPRAQARADKENDSHVSTAQWLAFINEAYLELWDLVVAAYGDHAITSADFTVAAGASTYTLPADFYKLRGLDLDPGTTNVTEVRRFAWGNRNQLDTLSYRIVGGLLRLEPAASAPGNYRIWYVPGATDLTGDASTISAYVEKWSEYIVVSAALKAKDKEESDVSVLMADRQRIEARIRHMAADRDHAGPDRVTDVRRVAILPRRP